MHGGDLKHPTQQICEFLENHSSFWKTILENHSGNLYAPAAIAMGLKQRCAMGLKHYVHLAMRLQMKIVLLMSCGDTVNLSIGICLRIVHIVVILDSFVVHCQRLSDPFEDARLDCCLVLLDVPCILY